MSRCTHIIIDEVHERDVEIDFLLIVVSRLLRESPNTKIILMSATMDADQFVRFFKVPLEDGSVFLPPKIDLTSSPRTYQIQEYYLEHFKKLWINSNIEQLINYEDPEISDGLMDFAVSILTFSWRQQLKSCSVFLVFLPGLHEIERFHEKLLNLKVQEEFKAHKVIPEICILHSKLSMEDQKIAFKITSNQNLKIILATNIAESGVTIPNVTHVLDFCLTKYQAVAKGAQISTLLLDWASRNNCKQRAGRAGRVCKGTVVRLVSKNFFDKVMNEYPAPELQRIGLESVVIRTKLLKMGSPLELLALALDPPTKSSVVDAVLHLKELGGLARTNDDGVFEYDNGYLSFIGEIMAALPMDVRIVKLIVVGYLLGVCEDSIIIGAGLSVKSIFSQSYGMKIESYSEKLEWAHGSGSDCIAILNTYKLWLNIRSQNDKTTEETWCKRHHLDLKNLHELRMLIAEVKRRLEKFLVYDNPTGEATWEERDKIFVLKICFAGAFGPANFFVPDEHSQDAERDAFRSVNNRDLFRTVYFKNMRRENGEIYEQQIREALHRKKIVKEDCNMTIEFDYPNSEKVFVTFDDARQMIESNESSCVTGKILPEVYKSVKMRDFDGSLSMFVMNPELTTKYAVEQGLGTMKNGMFVKKKTFIKNPGWCIEPTISTVRMHGQVRYVEHCNKFFFSPVKGLAKDPSAFDDRYMRINDEIQEKMKSAAKVEASTMKRDIRDGKFVIVVAEKNLMKRGRLVGNSSATRVDVYLIDYGSTMMAANIDNIFFIIDEFAEKDLLDYPPRIFECTLTEVQPSTLLSREGKWTQKAIDSFQCVVDKKAKINIYSVVNGVASVTLLIHKVNHNQKLIIEGFAEECEESYVSKANHEQRSQWQNNFGKENLSSDEISPEKEFENKTEKSQVRRVLAPSLSLCLTQVKLLGPYSPLELALNGISRMKTSRVAVDPSSVNSVILDEDILNLRGKFCVAAQTTINTRTNQMTIRETTMMPNIPPVLLALIFCPAANLRRDQNKTRFVSLLTGLGFDEKRQQPFFGERDALLNIDFELTKDDVEAINQLRFCMSQLLIIEPGKTVPDLVVKEKQQIMQKIRNLLLEILNKSRKFMDVCPPADAFDWNVDQDDAVTRTNPHGSHGMFGFIGVPPLSKMKVETKDALIRHVADLKRCADNKITLRNKVCQLCNYEWQVAPELKIHLLSKKHNSRYQNLVN